MGAGRQLEITFTQEEDSGRYACHARNIAGQAKADYKLLIMGESKQFFSKEKFMSQPSRPDLGVTKFGHLK